MASLRELQASFAGALRDPARTCAVLPPANLAVYRNNASFTFRETLSRTFPVVHRRVGDDYFRQLAVAYRERHPSRSGDLHDFGREFAEFLGEHLESGEYACSGISGAARMVARREFGGRSGARRRRRGAEWLRPGRPGASAIHPPAVGPAALFFLSGVLCLAGQPGGECSPNGPITRRRGWHDPLA